jgi:hypothetical protein
MWSLETLKLVGIISTATRYATSLAVHELETIENEFLSLNHYNESYLKRARLITG